MTLKATGKSVASSAIAAFFDYYTPKIVHINSKKVGIINRLIQLFIIGYIVGWVFVYKKGYQDVDSVISSATTKVKGVIYTNDSNIPNVSPRIWDVADYVIPPQEGTGFFVMTNVIVSPQTQGTCDEDPHKGVLCTGPTDHNCTVGYHSIASNGVQTGNCVKSTQNTSQWVCEVYAWCPVEVDKTPAIPVLKDSKQFTVLIKNNIEFPKFGVKRRNIIEGDVNKTYLTRCHYNSDTDPFCPIFKLDDIVNSSPPGYHYDDVSKQGAVFAIMIRWDCNLDLSIDDCVPIYSFKRLDRANALIANGWNFRYAHYSNNVTRTLYKAYGLYFKILVVGKAGKFNVIPFFQNLGSGLALLGIATILCDIVVLYMLKMRKFYADNKYLHVTGQDAYQRLTSESDNDVDHLKD